MGRAGDNLGLVENGTGGFPVYLRGGGARVKPHHIRLNPDSLCLWCDSYFWIVEGYHLCYDLCFGHMPSGTEHRLLSWLVFLHLVNWCRSPVLLKVLDAHAKWTLLYRDPNISVLYPCSISQFQRTGRRTCNL